MDDAGALIPRRDAFKINGLEFNGNCSPVEGTVRWDPIRSLINATMLLLAVVLGPLYFSWSALAVFFVLCFFTLCCGHSVGFHRRMIHRSFKCPKWLEYVMIYLGTAVGMGGPLWTIRTHDMREIFAKDRDASANSNWSHPVWAGWNQLGSMGSICSRRRLHHHALVYFQAGPHARSAVLDGRWRGDDGP